MYSQLECLYSETKKKHRKIHRQETPRSVLISTRCADNGCQNMQSLEPVHHNYIIIVSTTSLVPHTKYQINKSHVAQDMAFSTTNMTSMNVLLDPGRVCATVVTAGCYHCCAHPLCATVVAAGCYNWCSHPLLVIIS